MVGEMRGRFRRWLTRPPRPHGATIVNRRVSFLELFYDLVYVAVIGQTGHQLAEHISVRGVVEFAIIFGLIWIAWVNGSLYVELGITFALFAYPEGHVVWLTKRLARPQAAPLGASPPA